VGPADRRYRSIAAQHAAARRASGECGQCPVFGVRREVERRLVRSNFRLSSLASGDFVSRPTAAEVAALEPTVGDPRFL